MNHPQIAPAAMYVTSHAAQQPQQSSNAEMLRAAMDENNEGVQLMLRHEEQPALARLSQSLSLFQRILAHEESRHPQSAEMSSDLSVSSVDTDCDSSHGDEFGLYLDDGNVPILRKHREPPFRCINLFSSPASASASHGHSSVSPSTLPSAAAPTATTATPSSQSTDMTAQQQQLPPHMTHLQNTQLGRFHVHDAVVFNHKAFASQHCDLEALRLLSASVIWNLALLYHMRGIYLQQLANCDNRTNQMLLQKALCMYAKVLKVIGDDDDNITNTCGASQITLLHLRCVLRVATYNNMAQVHYDLQEDDLSQQTLLQLTILFTLPSPATQYLQQVLGMRTVQQIWINVLVASQLYVLSSGRALPAAAA
uniref:Uncharacterized protein n=1 Tax=Craspedostauros australis TaxID=1486917 RepID=A0A7R9WM10_9STRA|mmetsp:Transcript_11083/g.30613  ORF Transcript_11083/g.30613 Transcript_11083/m.30613 type:complete len:367 (+) Transcript_11083:71-1171(+)